MLCRLTCGINSYSSRDSRTASKYQITCHGVTLVKVLAISDSMTYIIHYQFREILLIHGNIARVVFCLSSHFYSQFSHLDSSKLAAQV
jgi:hypothetical protein